EVGMLKLMSRVDSKMEVRPQTEDKPIRKEITSPRPEAKTDVKSIQTVKPVVEEVKKDVQPSLTLEKTVEISQEDIAETVISQPESKPTPKSAEKRETPKEIFDGLTPSVIGFDFLLRLLVSADKNKRKNDELLWNRLENYLLDLVYARCASMLRGSQILCSGDGYLLVSVPYAGSASEINSPDNELMLARFSNELLGKSHKVFAVTEEERTSLLQLFREKKTQNTLPEGIVVQAPYIETKKQDDKPIENDLPDGLFALFGEGNIDIVREEKK
ncbi:MAG: hypothetical protein WBL80_08360, partial [Erysipelotrichaceae bacterium]